MNFSSPQKAVIDGREIVLFGAGDAVRGIDPADGSLEWQCTPQGWQKSSMIQPQQINESGILVGLGDGAGVARLDVNLQEGSWKVSEAWSSKSLKPSFNDFVNYQGRLFGFDQNIFTCIEAATGRRVWKQGRYGFGQVLLFEPQGLLLVLSDTGEIVLLKANSANVEELGRRQVLSGKTWNHPAYAHGHLYLRNGIEAVCLDL